MLDRVQLLRFHVKVFRLIFRSYVFVRASDTVFLAILTSSEKYFLVCNRGVSYALFISLLISKLFCTKALYGWGGGRDKVSSLCPGEGGWVVTGCSCSQPRINKITNVPVFKRRLFLMILIGAKYYGQKGREKYR